MLCYGDAKVAVHESWSCANQKQPLAERCFDALKTCLTPSSTSTQTSSFIFHPPVTHHSDFDISSRRTFSLLNLRRCPLCAANPAA